MTPMKLKLVIVGCLAVSLLSHNTLAIPAVQDLDDLNMIINNAASTIGADNNPNKGWGLFSGASGQLGTADLVNNITMTILRAKFQLDTDKTSWLRLDNITAPNSSTSSALHTRQTPPSPFNETTNLSPQYIKYTSSIPTLGSALISLGRAYHREMNYLVYQAINGLQQSMQALQAVLLQCELLNSAAVLRTIRASSNLEDAKGAWGRVLNLPGRTGDGESGDVDGSGGSVMKGNMRKAPANGQWYTHEELWGREQSSDGRLAVRRLTL